MTFPIPDAAFDDRLAILGTAGSGKTYLTTTAIERLLKAGNRIVAVDPLGVMWGLRLKADGKTPSGFNLPIFGGKHGDLPLTENAGALIGETVATMRESCIVDLSELPTKSAERRFMTAFLEAIYRHTDPSRVDPFHLVIDEADRFAPQKPPAGDETMLNRMEEIVRRGRVKGFIPWLITQRPAVLNKNVLSQADGLVLLKLTSSQDRDQVGAWIEGQADRAQGKAILGSLPAMQRGQGVVWIPGRNILATVQFPKKTTFDSSSAPKRGEKRNTTALKSLDLGALKDRLATVEIETKANDPAALKKRIADLEKAVKQKPLTVHVGEDKTYDPKMGQTARAEGWSAGYLEGDRDGFARGAAAALSQGFQAIQGAMKAFVGVEFIAPRKAPVAPKRHCTAASAPYRHHQAALTSMTRQALASVPRPAASDPAARPAPASLEMPLQRIVDAIRYWNVFGLEAPTHNQVAFIANYVAGSGTWNRYLSSLRSMGLIEPRGELRLTREGEAVARSPSEEPSGEALRASVLSKIDAPLVRILRPLIDRFPDSMSHDAVAEESSYQPGSGTWNRYLSSLRSLGLIEKKGPLKAQGWLFP